jgi:hypothetical protein
MELIKHGKNVHQLKVGGKNFKLAILSDLHWDNPKCDWDLLKKHMDYCLKNSIPIMLNGDTFCLMQGRGDRRSSKDDIRPEHNNARYLDSVVETAVEWFSPYAHLITVIGYGNHETAIIKWQETDILRRFVDLLNYTNNSNVQVGGYGGWLIINLDDKSKSGGGASCKIKYFHGSGGGGVVTKGAINLTRALEMCEDFDVFTMGHIHENAARNDVRESIRHIGVKGYEIIQRQLHLMITGTYKEEYGVGAGGWHVERGAPPKPLGGRILTFSVRREQKDNVSKHHKYIDSHKFNL